MLPTSLFGIVFSPTQPVAVPSVHDDPKWEESQGNKTRKSESRAVASTRLDCIPRPDQNDKFLEQLVLEEQYTIA